MWCDSCVEAGADVNARSRTYPQTVVGEQTQRSGREELNYTVLRGGSTPLLFAARSGDVESARLLLEAGASANDALPDGMSALVAGRAQRTTGVGDAAAREGRRSQRRRCRLHRASRRRPEERSGRS